MCVGHNDLLYSAGKISLTPVSRKSVLLTGEARCFLPKKEFNAIILVEPSVFRINSFREEFRCRGLDLYRTNSETY